jgi:hypothetical protein
MPALAVPAGKGFPMAQYLFMDTDIQVLIDFTRRELIGEIGQLTDTAILSQTNEQWLRYLLDKYTINVPTLAPEKAETTYVDGNVPEHQVPNPNFDNQPGVPGRIYAVHVPYSGPEELFYYKPRSYLMNSPIAWTSNSEITIHAGGAWHTPATIEAHFDGTIERIETNLRNLRNDVAPFNQELETLMRPRLEARRKSAEAAKATTAALKYPLRKREDASQTYKLPERPKPLAPKPIAKVTTAKAEQEYTLDETDYQEILRICTSMSLVMERSPTVFEHAEEEHIRVHYLVQLNGQYQGAATGETFNHTGKTDILIRHQDKNIFVAECKFWNGHVELIKTTSQLLGYTTWRDTKTALIIFSRRMNFSNVISEAQRAMKDHPQYKNGPVNEGESRFRYIFKHPNDYQREIIITLMLFDMPRPPKTP